MPRQAARTVDARRELAYRNGMDTEPNKSNDRPTAPARPVRAALAARPAADQLLAALEIDVADHPLEIAAAFRALAEEVLYLRGETSRQRKALDAAELLADRDGLCPVFNRRAFARELSREMALARRHSTPLCLLYIDLDHFKLVNDRFGHARGDAALMDVCAIVQAQVRETDIVGRLGGDEFGVILTHAALADGQLKAAALTAEIDRLTIGEPGGPGVTLGASCGVVQWDGEHPADRLISQADEAMFRAKAARKAGRG